MVIVTSGADIPGNFGFGIWIRQGRMYVRVSTTTREWTVVTTEYTVDEFMEIKFSWSVQTGEIVIYSLKSHDK